MLICTVLVSTFGIVISDCWLCVSCRTGAMLLMALDRGTALDVPLHVVKGASGVSFSDPKKCGK